MGLLDIINGMQNGPRGQSTPTATSSGGMSPITIALVGLLAYKAIKHLSPDQSNTASASPNVTTNSGASGSGLGNLLSGGLGGLLQGPLGGLLAGGAAGSIVSGGLSDLLKQFQQSGQGDVAKTWVDNGPNKEISPDDLSKALGADQIKTLMAHSGMSRDELLTGLSQQLPELVNELTPNGRLPNENETSRLI
jgi:uncharacterized protein YidB (DUF937 family)